MKKLICICFVLLLCSGMFGCQKTEAPTSIPTDTSSIETSTPTHTTTETQKPTEPPVKETEPLDTLLPLDDSEAEIISYENDILETKCIGKMLPNVLVVTPYSRKDVFGDTVYVLTDEFDDICVGDEVRVFFSQIYKPYDNTLYTRIIADDVMVRMVTYKPIIYFYPESPAVCSAKVTLNGDLTCTYPTHGDEGWQNFTAYPDGTLIFPDGQEYYALYWEGVQDSEWDFSKGFCVKGEDTAEFLEWALDAQGLSRREANEFIIYWLPQMEDNLYNVISFQTDRYTDGAVLDITPAPDSLLRVFMAYYPSDEEVTIDPQSFDGFDRSGFTVVEWGGSPCMGYAANIK